MYFLHGWPKSYQTPLRGEGILVIRHSPDFALIAIVTPSTVFLWSGDQHRILLGQFTRSPILISRDGDNEDVYWRPSGHLALTTRGGRIYFLDISEESNGPDLLKNPMDNEEGNSTHSNVKRPLKLTLRGTFLVASNTGIAWMYESQSKLHICTHDGYLQRWTPTRDQFHLDEELPLYAFSQVSFRVLMAPKQQTQANQSEQLTPRLAPNIAVRTPEDEEPATDAPSITEVHSMINEFMEDLAVNSIVYSSTRRTMLVAFQGGRAAVLLGNLEASLADLKMHWLPVQGATVVAINERKKLLVVGLDTGDVCLFDMEIGFRLKKQLSLLPWGISKKITGAAKRLDWTPDGRVLAVGYAARGFSTWSSYGCRLNCSISEMNVMNEEHQIQIASAYFTPASVKASGRKTKSRDKTASVRVAQTLPHPTPSIPNSNSSTSPVADGSMPPSTPATAANGPTRRRASSTATPASHHEIPTIHTAGNMQATEAAMSGVNTMSWGDGGYTLLVSTMDARQANVFEQYHFVKASVAANMNLNSCQRILLQGADRLLMLMSRGKELKELSWKHLPLPAVFDQDNWPITIVSMSPDGAYIAVAGQRGFVLLNVASGTWSLFGDRMEEHSFRCISLSWFRHYLVVAAWNEAAKAHQVMFFPKHLKLAFSSLAFRGNVPQNRTPTFVDCNDASLILFTTDAYFQYKVISDDADWTATATPPPGTLRPKGNITLKLTHQIGIDTPFDVTSVLVLPSTVVLTEARSDSTTSAHTSTNNATAAGDASPAPSSNITMPNVTIHPPRSDTPVPYSHLPGADLQAGAVKMPRSSRSMSKLLVLDTQGVLSLTNAERSINFILSKSIEQFWMANADVANHDLGNSLWAFGEHGLEVWFPFFAHSVQASQNQNYLTRERSLDFDPEVCPIGFLPRWGLIVGTCQGPTRTYSTNTPCFSYETKTQPFLHSVLKRMIEKAEIGPAVEMAKRYTAISHFQHTLELLLHEALESQHQLDKRARRKRAKQKAASNKSATDDLGEMETPISSARTSLDYSSEMHLHTPTPTRLPASMQTIGKPGTPNLISPPSSQPKRARNDEQKETVLLRYILEFLREFGTSLYTTVVVSCARKTDPALWHTLFHPRYAAGKPRALFEQCLATGSLSVAVSYLRVIQYTEGEADARRAALQCLDLCLKLNNLELLHDLMRFLDPSATFGKSGSSPEQLARAHGDVAPLTNVGNGGKDIDEKEIRKQLEGHTTGGYNMKEEQFVLDDTLGRYARKLLIAHDMKSLVLFSKISRHSLRNWLVRERKKAAIVEDFPAALAKLHQTFSIPHPTHFPLNHLFFDAENSMQDYSIIYFPNSDFLLQEAEDSDLDSDDDSDVSMPSLSGPSSSSASSSSPGNILQTEEFLFQESWQDTSMSRAFKDLEYLLREMLHAECAGWSLLIATILFRVPTIITILEKHPIFWKVYRPTLETVQARGYNDLLKHLLSHFGMT